MRFAGPAAARAIACAVALVCLAGSLWYTPLAAGGADLPPSRSSPELRALWVLRTSLESPERIRALVRSAHASGFNTLLVQVRGRGDAYYGGGVEPRAGGLDRQPPGFDPLAEVLRAAGPLGLRVHAWVNVNLVSSAVTLPAAREHVVNRRPEWLMVPRALARDLARRQASDPAYVARLAQWTRAHANDVEGLYTTPIQPGAVAHVAALVRALVGRYAVDGVHFDYARYPNDAFDYSRGSLREFREAMDAQLPAARRAELARRAAADVAAYADALPEAWRSFRLARMTAMMTQLADAARAGRPSILVSVAVKSDIPEAVSRRLQEWPRWVERGVVDAVAPMAYTTDPSRFAEQIAAARSAAGVRQVWAGIGAYRLTPAQTVANIAAARRLGADGVALFSYDSLTDPRQAPGDYLGAVSRSAFVRFDAAEGSR